MQISDEDLNEFIELYKMEFHEDITAAEAGEMATDLIGLYTALIRPLPEELKR
jgi:hypothetical protein